jgi:hypothetical protein
VDQKVVEPEIVKRNDYYRVEANQNEKKVAYSYRSNRMSPPALLLTELQLSEEKPVQKEKAVATEFLITQNKPKKVATSKMDNYN